MAEPSVKDTPIFDELVAEFNQDPIAPPDEDATQPGPGQTLDTG